MGSSCTADHGCSKSDVSRQLPTIYETMLCPIFCTARISQYGAFSALQERPPATISIFLGIELLATGPSGKSRDQALLGACIPQTGMVHNFGRHNRAGTPNPDLPICQQPRAFAEENYRDWWIRRCPRDRRGSLPPDALDPYRAR